MEPMAMVPADNPYSPPNSPLDDPAAVRSAQPDRKLSRWLVGIELFLIAIPSSLLLLAYGLFGASTAIRLNAPPEYIAAVAGTLIALAGLVSGWVLGLSFVIGGRSSLAARPRWLWIVAACGGGVALLGLAANFIPSAMYSSTHRFLNQLGMFSLGMPLLLPLTHLVYERGWLDRR